MTVFLGLMIPFLGTTLGAACVFFLKNALGTNVQKALLGFASGVMVAASVWSLLIPSMDLSASMGRLAFVPACGGLLAGMAFLLLHGPRDPAPSHGRGEGGRPQLFAEKAVPCWCWQSPFITSRKEWRWEWFSPACWQKTPISPRRRPSPSPSVSPSRTSRKEPSFPFR